MLVTSRAVALEVTKAAVVRVEETAARPVSRPDGVKVTEMVPAFAFWTLAVAEPVAKSAAVKVPDVKPVVAAGADQVTNSETPS